MKVFLACTALALLIGGRALAADDEAAPKIVTAHGSIVSINAEDKSMVISVVAPGGKSHDMTLVLNDQSKIVKNGGPATVADLKEKDSVTVAYREENSQNVVVDLDVESKG